MYNTIYHLTCVDIFGKTDSYIFFILKVRLTSEHNYALSV